MNKRFISFFCLAAMSACAMAAPVNYAQANLAAWKTKKGNWSDIKNWNTNAIPSGFTTVNVSVAGCEAIVNKGVPLVRNAWVGSKGSGSTLVIEDGGKLAMEAYLSLGIFGNGTVGHLELRGGQLELGTNDMYGVLLVGKSATFSSKGFATFSGGTYKGSMQVGGSIHVAGAGVLVIKGSSVVVEDNTKTVPPIIGETGVVEFILDEKGVATLDYPTRNFTFNEGAILRVNAEAYTGKDKRITLIVAKRFTGVATLKKELTGLRSREGEIVLEKSSRGATLVLKFADKPR